MIKASTSGNRRAFICPVNASQIRRCAAPQATRREVLQVSSCAGLTLLTAQPALAKLPKGFMGVRDTGDGYEFIYPFGWQEVSVSGVDAVYKDVIEPLESLSVQLTPTSRKSITEYGPANEIAGTLANSVLAKSSDEVQLIKSEAEQADGKYGNRLACMCMCPEAQRSLQVLRYTSECRDYVAFEFLQKSSRFTRHVVAVATVANGNLILFTTGSSERRWNKMQEKLSTTVKSFKAFTVLKG